MSQSTAKHPMKGVRGVAQLNVPPQWPGKSGCQFQEFGSTRAPTRASSLSYHDSTLTLRLQKLPYRNLQTFLSRLLCSEVSSGAHIRATLFTRQTRPELFGHHFRVAAKIS